jgi:hypothetical protein
LVPIGTSSQVLSMCIAYTCSICAEYLRGKHINVQHAC